MARGMPSMTALLGLLAVAGYQNRDKISDMLAKARNSSAGKAGGASPQQGQSGSGDLLSDLGGLFGGSAAGGTLSNGLGELMKQFGQNGQQETADSWVNQGPNKNVDARTLEQALGRDTISDVAMKTGLSEQEVLSRLSNSLPQAVDGFTPDGHLPDEREADMFR